PPPPSSVRLAALTIASTASVVMSATSTSSRAGPISAVSSGVVVFVTATVYRAEPAGQSMRASCRPFRGDLGGEIDRAAHPDVVEMGVEEAARGVLPLLVQQREEVEIGVELAVGGELLGVVVERDPVHVDAPVFAGALAARQPALVDQPGHEVDGAELGEQRGIERDLVDAVHDLV